MTNLSGKQKLIGVIIALGLALMAIFKFGFYQRPVPVLAPEKAQPTQTQSQNVQVVSTDPAVLEEATLLPAQPIKITFDTPIVNRDEIKRQITPALDYTVKLSDDRKTAIFTPVKTYAVGSGYTLMIKGDTKFDGGKRLEGDKFYHFKTLEYKGV